MEIFYNPAKNFCGSPNTLTLVFDNQSFTLVKGFNQVDGAITKHPDYTKLVEVGAFTEKQEVKTTTRRKPAPVEPIKLEA